jgi:hypothetical protein
MTGLVARTCDNRLVAAGPQRPECGRNPPFNGQVIPNLLRNQVFGSNHSGLGEPLFLASNGVIQYPGQSAAADIRSM